MVERRKQPTPRTKPKQLAKRLEEFIVGHNKLSKLVNQIVIPNIQELAKLANSVINNSRILAHHAIMIYIIKRKLGITDDEYAEAKAYLYDRTEKNSQSSSVQSTETGRDEDRSSDGQRKLLDAESSRSHNVSGVGVPVRKHSRGSRSDTQDAGPGDPSLGVSSDKTIVIKKSAAMGPSEMAFTDLVKGVAKDGIVPDHVFYDRNVVMKASQLGVTDAHKKWLKAQGFED